MNNMNISIFLSCWQQNLWDELILKNEIKLLKKEYWENTLFTVFTYDLQDYFLQDYSIKYIEYFPISIKNPKNIIRNIKNFYNFIYNIYKSDLIVVWWWWIFYENEVLTVSNPLNIWYMRMLFFKFFMKKVLFYWVSIEIWENSTNLYKIKKIFSMCDDIRLRNKYSFDLLKKISIKSQIIDDPVFYDAGDNYIKKDWLLSLECKKIDIIFLDNIDFYGKTIWIAFRRWYISDEIIQKICNFITQKWWKIILLPHSFHKTNKESNDEIYLKQFLSNKNISITSNMIETYEVYKQKKIDLCLSMRLHSAILCQVYDIDYIKFSYSYKTK